jgi:membrane protease YdiL (CAAX protease family)
MVSDYRRERKRDHPEVRWLPYSGGDLIFTGALSLNAGATEEAFFRGYLFPLFHQWSGERSWASNSAQGLLFALAHVGSVKIPVVQGFMGLYLGWMTERNGWTLGQAVCVHFWWDVITVAGALLTRNRISEIPISLGAISLPLNW